MSASDAAPLPRLGEVFFDVRGDSRSMRLSWYADTGVAVFSIWQGETCTGTFRLPIADLPRMVTALQRGPGAADEQAGPADPAGPPADSQDRAPRTRSLRPARPSGADADIATGQWDVAGGVAPPGPPGPGSREFPSGYQGGGPQPELAGYRPEPRSAHSDPGGGYPAGPGADSGRGERPGGYLPEPGTGGQAGGGYGYPAAPGAGAAPGDTGYLPGPDSGPFPAGLPEPRRGDDRDAGYLPDPGIEGFPAGSPGPDGGGYGTGSYGTGSYGTGGYGSGGHSTGLPEPGRRGGGPDEGYLPGAGSEGFPAAPPGPGHRDRPDEGYLPDPGYLPGRGSEGPAGDLPEPGRRGRRAGRGYVSGPGSGGHGTGLPEPGLPEPGLPERGRQGPRVGGYVPEPGGEPRPAARRGRRAAGPDLPGYPSGSGSGDFPAPPDTAYLPPRRGRRTEPEPAEAPTGLLAPHQPDKAGVEYRNDPEYRSPNSPRGPHYPDEPPIADYRRVSPSRPYEEPDPAGADDDPGGEWDGPVPPPPGGYPEGPPPESFPYGHTGGNERRRRRG